MSDAKSFDQIAGAVLAMVANSDLLNVDEVQGAGNKTSPISGEKAELALRRVDATGTPDMLVDWRKSDRAYRGGRTAAVSDRANMAVGLILAEERSPLLISEFATAFRVRLTPEARQVLGVENVKVMSDANRDQRAWYARCWRGVHSIINTFNAWPAPGQVMTRAEREAAVAARTPEMQAVKSARAREFTYAWLEMTLQALPEEYRNAWKGSLSADQTAVRAPSQLMPWRRDHELPGSPEVPNKWRIVDENGDTQHIEAPRPVLEIDATPYPRNKSKKDKTFAGGDSAYELSYAANITMMVTEPGQPLAHPQLIMAASLHRFGRSIAEHTLAGIASLQQRGWTPKRLTVDLGYSAGIAPINFHIPLSKMGVQLVSDYHRSRLGTHQTISGGALLVEGTPVCPATPMDLRTATKDANDGTITPAQWRQRKDRLNKFSLRPKEKVNPDDGSQPWMCPARGLSPTVNCVIVEMAAKAKVDPTRPKVHQKMLPGHLDRVCRQHSVRIEAEELAMFQTLKYGSEEWSKTYSHDRQSMESMNAHLKTGHGIHESRNRRIHGLAAQSFVFTLIVAAANLGRINKFLSDRAAGITGPSRTPRKRDVEDRTRYRRWSTPPTVVRGQTTKEKRQAAAKGKNAKRTAATPAEERAVTSEVEAFDDADDTATS